MSCSTADTNNWSTLLNRGEPTLKPEITSFDHERTGPTRQRQRRLTAAQVAEMALKYDAGATVYELAAEFGCHRATLAERLKKAGVKMHLKSPPDATIDEMPRLYELGLSLATIGKQLCASPQTVRRYVNGRGIPIRTARSRPQ